MDITEVRIKLMENSEDRLRGFCSVTFDHCFVIRDLKIIEGDNGPFVAMPSRKLTANCIKCHTKNHLRARFCNFCGTRQKIEHFPQDNEGRARLYADIAHPVNAACREMIQKRVIEEFRFELDRAKQPGYVSRYDDDYSSVDMHQESPVSQQSTDQLPKTRMDPAEPTVTGGHSEESERVKPADSAGSANHNTESGFGKGIL